ncbi:MAG TPA: multidrug effflux MFS transporter [Arachnia sp.]|jgi:DHA1 family bicyclomycin/chloramphenicol resistance-like MFS transporter|nr:multidrug effflux MFS transporter [Propionibacteriaceae bacterium]HOA27090.1 multidrug effflux MFS transporter [Arachnia sp.]HQD21625.1 multidrug effflux MFS transporter [Arachnia sp.]
MSSDLGSRFSKRRRIAIIVTLGLLTGLGPFTIDLYLPAFPSLKGDLGITDAQVQVTLSATTLGFAIGQLVIGPWSDRIGRRVPLMVASSLHVAASVLVAVAPNVEFLTAMRALQGIGAAGGAVVAMAMARDLFDGRALVKTLARLSLISGLAPILAPILGSWMVTVMSWRGIFWGLALYGAVIIALVLRFTVETRPPAERTRGGIGPLLASYRTVVSDRIFLGALLVASFGFAGLFSYVSTSSVLLQEVYGLSAQGFGAVFATCSVGIFVGIQTGARLALRVGSHWMIACGNALMILAAAGVLAVGILDGPLLALVPCMFAYTLGFGFCAPNNNVLALQRHRTASGVAASLMGSSSMLAGSLVGPIIGSFEMTDATPMGAAMLICAALAGAALWLVLRPHRFAAR